MKYAFALAAVAGLASASAHAGHQQFHRRAGVETVTDWTVVTVTDVVTVFGPAPTAQATTAAAPSHSSASQAAPVVSSAKSSSSSAAAVETTPVAAPTTPVVAPPAATPTTLQTVTSQAPKQQPAPSSSSVPVAAPVPTTTSVAAAPAQTSSAPSTGGSGDGNYGIQAGGSVPANCPKGTPCAGDMTTYDPSVGLGSCGYQDSQTDDVVALQMNMFGTLSNSGANQPSNKLCNKKIQITNPKTGATAVGTIRDRCPGCTGPGGIDLSDSLMKKVNGGVADGRIPVSWYFLD